MLCSRIACLALVAAALVVVGQPASAAELTSKEVLDPKGDGADGKGNTADDTWQFWLQLVTNKGQYVPLDIYTPNMTPDQRQNGIRDAKAKRGKQKVQGPVAGKLPNGADKEGWIYHSDWDARMEGAWVDKKTNEVMLHPYVEKRDHRGVAVSYKVPEDGKYKVSGKVTDLMVEPLNADIPRLGHVHHDGVVAIVELGDAGNKVSEIGRSKPIGDGEDRPNSDEFSFSGVEAKKGQLIRLVIDPRDWWGSDLTKVENLKVEKE